MIDKEAYGRFLERIGETAHRYERGYHGCSQCILKTLQEHLNLDDGGAFKAASALAGGVARMGEVCGALTGGIMAIGLAFGRERLDHPEAPSQYAKAMDLAIELYKQFEEEFGSTLCREIQRSILGRSFDLKDPRDGEAFKSAGGYEECSKVVARGARLSAEIILKERGQG